MKNISALRSLWRFRSLMGSTSMAIKAVNPRPSLDTEEKLIRDHLSKKLIRDQGSVKNDIDMVVLRKLVDHASKFLNDKVTKAVITVPAYFNDSQRTATKDAGRIAGLEVLRIINEPTAALLAYDFEKKNNETILVFDLGAGNFDVSVLEVGDGVFEVLSTSGDTHLGGDDFDKRIVDWLAGNFENDERIDLLKDKQALKRLTEAAQKAKMELSYLTQTNISLPFITATAYDPKHIETTLTRAKFEELCSDLLDRLRTPVDNALREAKMQFKDIDEVILVGGSTRIPAFQELVKKMTRKDPNVTVNPDEVVALGAAVQEGVQQTSRTLEQQTSYMLNTNWSFPRRFHGTTQLDLGKKRKDSINQKFPGNTARIVLNPDDLTESKRSYLNGIRKIQEWCKANSTSIDISSYFGPGAEVYPTPEDGTFYLTFVYKEREITFFIYGRNLYIKGWQVGKGEIFEMREKDDSTKRFIQDPRCILMKMGVNYNRLCKDGNVGNVRIGFKAMTDNFEVLHKSKSISNDVMEALACFVVHGPEAVRLQWVLEDILESFESSLNLDSKRSLSTYVWSYSYYSSVYLRCADCIANGQQVPKITNRPPGNIKDLHELRSLIRIPLRTARKKFSKKDKSKKEPPEPSAVWSPPYADGHDWHLKEEEQEGNKTNLEEEAEMEELKRDQTEPKQKSEVQLEDQEAVDTEVKDQPNLEDNAGGSIMTRHFPELSAGCMSFENDRAGEYGSVGIRCPGQNTSDMMKVRGVQINTLAGFSGHRRWLRISRFLRWFIR